VDVYDLEMIKAIISMCPYLNEIYFHGESYPWPNGFPTRMYDLYSVELQQLFANQLIEVYLQLFSNHFLITTIVLQLVFC
jgi:hypothetical protein